MPNRLSTLTPCGAIALVCVLVAPLEAQQILNPGFDSTFAGWTSGWQVELEWSPLDGRARLDSGSARVTNLHDSELDASGAYQCVEIQPATAYWVRSRMMVPTEEPASTGASLSYQLYSGAGCFGDLLATGSSGELSGFGSDAWQCRGVGFTSPASTSSLRLRLSVFKQDAGGASSAHFDDVLLLEGLFFDDFECGDHLLWSANTD